MQVIPPPSEIPLSMLVRQAIDEARTLAKLEVQLAKNEVRREAKEVATSAVSFGVAAVLALLAAVMLLFALVLALGMTPLRTLLVAVGLLVLGGIAALWGVRALPKKPLSLTRGRIERDVRELKEHIA